MSRRRRQAATPEDHHRATMVRRVAEILDDPDAPSRFAHEGACRHGLRSAFCLAGAKWDVADAMAATIVSAALVSIGARRPAWHEGQPEWAQDGIILVERTLCARCGGQIPDDAGHGRKYCSDVCRSAGTAQLARAHGIRRTWAEYSAARAAQKEHNRRQREVPCEHCGKPYIRRDEMHRPQRYCSHQCYSKAKIGRYRLRKKSCKQCGTKFQPRHSSSVFCSNACRLADRAIKPVACAHCGKDFLPDTKGRRLYCSHECYCAGKTKPRPERTCPTCLSIFRPPYPSHPKKYCSQRCADLRGTALAKQESTPTEEETSDPPPIMLAAE